MRLQATFLIFCILLKGSLSQTCISPDFDSGWFTMNAGSSSVSDVFREFTHSLSDIGEVEVISRLNNGLNSGFHFPSFGLPQTDKDYYPYGGLAAGYTSSRIRIWSPSSSNGFLVNTGIDGWGGEINVQAEKSGSVRAIAWGESYSTADYDSGWFTMSTSTNNLVRAHNFGAYPARVKVLARINSGTNQNYIFEGVGTAMKGTSASNYYSGVVFSYDTTNVYLYVPSSTFGYFASIQLGWGLDTNNQQVTSGSVRVVAWRNTPFAADYDSGWFSFSSQAGASSYTTRTHGLGVVPEKVLVQVKDRSNGRIYEAVGSSQADDDDYDDYSFCDNSYGTCNFYGGVVYGYDTSTVRLWAPDLNDGNNEGRIISIWDGWGGGVNIAVQSADVRVQAWRCYPHTKSCPTGQYRVAAGCLNCNCGVGATSSSCDSTGKCTCNSGFSDAKCTTCSAGLFVSGSSCVSCGCGIGASSSSCDSSGVCTCNSGFAGPKCSNCNDNFYLSGSSCLACNCGSTGSSSTQCDSSGNCPCRTGYTGAKCTSCSSGFYLSGSTCLSCGCGIGATSSSCDSSGKCTCKPNFGDSKCSTCASSFYLSGSDCLSCGCDSTGSVNLNCDSSAKCTCKAGFTGTKCDQCLPGYYGPNCLTCPSCLNGVCLDTKSGDGKCSCNPRWTTGVSGQCDTCEAGRFGATCEPCGCGSGANGTSCNSSGVCNCLETYSPPKCTGCASGKYGASCMDCNCDTNGSNGVECDGSGNCNCKSGYTGAKCASCATGLYFNGTSCISCNCGIGATSSSCDLSGKCICSTNFADAKCTTCSPSYFLSGSLCQECGCGVAGSANTTCQSNGNCFCKSGFTGGKCTSCLTGFFGPSCSSCPNCGLKGKCSETISGDGKCICDPGWAIGVSGKCDVCVNGFFGTNCDQPCLCGSGSTGIGCNSTGHCTCQTGFSGMKCSSCANGYYGTSCIPCNCGSGASSISCDNAGVCNCNTGFASPKCTNCLQGFFGVNCNSCSCGAGDVGGGGCNVGGNCSCAPNFSDVKCTTCLSGFFLSGSTCRECLCGLGSSSSSCDSSGTCACRPGFAPPKCSDCNPGFFGATCQACPNCGEKGSCDGGVDGSGKCICNSGWTIGPSGKCDICVDGKYGPDCQLDCGCGSGANSTRCDIVTGDCVCNTGSLPPKCSSCNPGFFGNPCQPCGCGTAGDNGKGLCSEQGVCTCKSNYKEPKCTTCADRFFGVNCTSCDCGLGDNGNGKCDSNGKCTCNPNFADAKCTTCLPGFLFSGTQCIACNCGVGSSSENCNNEGNCECRSGFAIPKCTDCATNHFGTTCQQCIDCGQGSCDSGINGDGKCICSTNWTIRPNSNGRCDSCITGKYGANCSLDCPNCENGICSQGVNGTGQCICQDGWRNDPNESRFCSICDNGFSVIEGKCTRCHPSCSSCSGTSNNECISCAGNLVYDSVLKTCSSNCNQNQYTDGKTCQSCDGSCSTCLGPSSSDCIDCPTGKVFDQGSCLDSCQTENSFVLNGVCKGCDVTCNGCNGLLAANCTSCKNPFVLDDGYCLDSCGSNKTFIDDQNRCQPCSSSCETCSGPSSSDCLSCPNGFNLLSGSCVNNCPSGYFSDPQGSCFECNELCSDCDGPRFSQCTDCFHNSSNPFLDSKTCVNRCGKFKYAPEGQFDCVSCDCNLHSSSCDDNGACVGCGQNTTGTNCEKCARGYFRTSSNLTLECDKCDCNNRADDCDASNGVCIDCKENTEGNNCESCKLGFEWNSDNTGCFIPGEESEKGFPKLYIGLIVAGVLICIIIIVFVAVVYILSKKNKNLRRMFFFNDPTQSTVAVPMVPTSLKEFESFASGNITRRSLGQTKTSPEGQTIINTVMGFEIALPGYLKVEYNELRPEKEIASGGGGKIFYGSVLNSEIRARFPEVCDHVAIKIINDRLDLDIENNLHNFLQEVSVTSSMAYHPNIAKIIAYTESPNCIVSPLYQGDLGSLIHSPEHKYTILDVMDILQHIASAFDAIHSTGVAHRDIKPKNMLLERRKLIDGGGIGLPGEWSNFPYRIKICDFGVCYVDAGSVAAKQVLTNLFGVSPRYAPPEVFTKLGHSKNAELRDYQMADIYSFAITVWETVHRQFPWGSDEISTDRLRDLVVSGERPPITFNQENQLSTFVLSLIKVCWAQDPTSRFSFTEINSKIRSFMSQVPTDNTNLYSKPILCDLVH